MSFVNTSKVVSLAILIMVSATVSAQDKGSFADDYRRPVVAIPYAWQKPTIDGVVDEAEWQGAMSHRAMQTTGKQVSTRQTRFWMMWDEEHIYVAMRCPLRQGERVVNALRERERETNVVFDDSYEVWITVNATDPLTGQPNCTTQFLANFAGARYDVLHQPAVGNSRTNSYATGWEPVSRITPNNEWEYELVIDRASLGETREAFHDGMSFRCLIARNFKRPWEQNSFEGTSSFSVVDTHSQFVMSKTAPALHLLSVGDSVDGTFGIHLAAQGQTDGEIAWTYQSEDVTRDGTAKVAKGTYREIVNASAIDKPGRGKLRITVTGRDGATLLDWAADRQFGYSRKRVGKDDNGRPVFEPWNPAADVLDDRGDVLDIRTTLNPERDYIRVFGDLINYDDRDRIEQITVMVSDANGKELNRSSTTIDELAYAKDLILFDTLAPGTYQIRLECKDAAGKVLVGKDSEFEKKDPTTFDWWQTKRGNIETVIAPWTPVTLAKDEHYRLGVWGREMSVGVAGLPSQVITQGKPILAQPGRLVATDLEGRKTAAQGVAAKLIFDQDFRKTLSVESTLGDIDIRSEVCVEFDGLYKVTMTLDPKQPTTLKGLQVVLPYHDAMANYIHAVTAEIRSGFFYGFTPRGNGRVWDSNALGDRSMQVGTFIPYVWLGSSDGGLCWFADSDQGWMPNDDVPAIELQRNREGQVDFVLNLISSETTLDAPRTITFGLQASPVKEMHKGWREDPWWCGDTFKQYAHSQNLIFASTPFVVKGYEEEAQALVDAQHKAGKPAVPYFIHTSLPGHLVPEMAYFGEQWRTTVDEALCYRGSFNDFMIHNWGEWAETFGIDGYYIDNMRPILCDNIEHGCGYRLPDGRVQPTFQMFDTRDYFLRSRAAFLESRPESKLVIHMTNSMIVPWVGPADVCYDGEHHVIYPEMDKDFMDFWSLERMRVDYPAQWGVAVNFMHEYQGAWDPVDLHRVKRAYFATVLLHDALPTGNNNGHARNLSEQRAKFGIGDANVSFLPYWQDTGLTTKGSDIKLAGWRKPDKLMLLVANFGEQQAAQVSIDTAKLGWNGAPFIVADAEAGYQQLGNRRIEKTDAELAAERQAWDKHEQAMLDKNPNYKPRPFRENRWRNERIELWNGDDNQPVTQSATNLTVPVERHNYRLLILEKR